MMQGLLDDQNSAGLLSLGLRLMSTPGKFGTALGQAGLGAMGDIQQMKAQQQAQKTRALQEQMLQMQLQQAMQSQKDRQSQAEAQRAAQQQRQGFLGSLDTSAGVGQPFDPARALAAGLSPQEIGLFMPKDKGTPDKDVELLKLIHGENTPAFMAALRALEKKRTTHAPPAQQNNYGAPVPAVDANGNPVFIRATKNALEPAIVPGVRPPMSAAEERSASEKSSRERQARQMVSGLNDAEAILQAGRATDSGIGTVVDAAARIVGKTTIGAQDAARLATLSGWLVANVPRMEGPQSNFDVQNYREMAGKIGDSTVPIAERKAALAEVRRLQQKYAELNGTPIESQSSSPVRRYNPQTGRIE